MTLGRAAGTLPIGRSHVRSGANVRDADGFFLNVSNYETTERQLKYGNRIARCVQYGTDAFLWVKGPGQSDGQCDRGTGTGHDPARGGIADPAAGVWFDEQARELVIHANPPLC